MKCHCIKFKQLAYCTECISPQMAVIYKYLNSGTNTLYHHPNKTAYYEIPYARHLLFWMCCLSLQHYQCHPLMTSILMWKHQYHLAVAYASTLCTHLISSCLTICCKYLQCFQLNVRYTGDKSVTSWNVLSPLVPRLAYFFLPLWILYFYTFTFLQ
jgi:hypothetical protein